MGRREGRFPGAPGRAAREARRAAERVPAAALPATLSCPGLEAARGVERGIRAFRNLAKEHDGQVRRGQPFSHHKIIPFFPSCLHPRHVVLVTRPAESAAIDRRRHVRLGIDAAAACRIPGHLSVMRTLAHRPRQGAAARAKAGDAAAKASAPLLRSTLLCSTVHWSSLLLLGSGGWKDGADGAD